MNKDIFIELRYLIEEKDRFSNFLKHLKSDPTRYVIKLDSGIETMGIDNDLIPILINYYENKVIEIENKINKFKLFKIID